MFLHFCYQCLLSAFSEGSYITASIKTARAARQVRQLLDSPQESLIQRVRRGGGGGGDGPRTCMLFPQQPSNVLMQVRAARWPPESVTKYVQVSTCEVCPALCGQYKSHITTSGQWTVTGNDICCVRARRLHYQLSRLSAALFLLFYGDWQRGKDGHTCPVILCKYPVTKIQSHIKMEKFVN